ncbi:hypothetical protein EWM64_g2243 [Hericium alpestre]|uniref:Syntaxin N-terminal domain-containing protein n=1 Tax=Hericium alpestre TaxID=135208 RepID=A0A4Z0A767_9AGAM|nr:hypothetical protein EWM64_g2243 [Hericium alpestre]
MARDRLAAMRAQRQGTGPTSPPGQQLGIEMGGLNHQDHITNGNGRGTTATADPMAEFYAEINTIQDMIRQFESNVSRVSEMHARSLGSLEESEQNTAILDELVSETRNLSNQIKNRIQDLEKQPVPPGQDLRIRKNQTSLVRTKFVEAVQNYQQVEQQYRRRYKERVERQFKIVKPDATQDEVNAVVNDETGAGGQIFSQALMSTTRYAESRQAYREVQDRHQDIRKIENTLAELAQIFNDANDTINAIQTSAANVEHDTEAGLGHTERAVKSARAARRKRWYCFFLVLIILAIVGIVVGVTVGRK